jgi:2,4-dienoyl-CoA reductase (NADPH2)
VTIVEEEKRIAGDVIPSFKWRHTAWVEELEIRTLTSSHVVSVTREGATVKNAKGEETFVAADMVVVSGPRLANHDLFQEFQWMIDELHGAGDAVIARDMNVAIHEGYRMGVRI